MDARASGLSLDDASSQSEDAGLCAVFIRAEAARRGDGNLVLRTLAEKGLDTLMRIDVDQGIRASLDGWLAENGIGIPSEDLASVVFTHDLHPITPDDDERRDYPRCDNARALLARYAVETEINRQAPRHIRYVPAVLADSSAQAWSLLTVLAPNRASSLRAEMAQRSAAFPKLPALRDLSRYACRARVELIDWNGARAVRKTFRPGSERFLARELEVFRRLGPECGAIPKLLETGPGYFIMEYIEEADQLPLRGAPALLPLAQVRQLAAFVQICVGNGFDPIDLKPIGGNALYTRNGLKIIDYEFWRRCGPSTSPEQSYCLAGLPADYDGDRAWGLIFPFKPYPLKWRRVTGLNPRSLLYDPPWLQHVKRVPWSIRARIARSGRAMASRLLRQAAEVRRPA